MSVVALLREEWRGELRVEKRELVWEMVVCKMVCMVALWVVVVVGCGRRVVCIQST